MFVHHTDFAAIQDEKEKLERQLKSAHRALKNLMGEVAGTLSAHECAIRQDFGNSNWECLKLRIKEAADLIVELETV